MFQEIPNVLDKCERSRRSGTAAAYLDDTMVELESLAKSYSSQFYRHLCFPSSGLMVWATRFELIVPARGMSDLRQEDCFPVQLSTQTAIFTYAPTIEGLAMRDEKEKILPLVEGGGAG
jgi:hypothetical protein